MGALGLETVLGRSQNGPSRARPGIFHPLKITPDWEPWMLHYLVRIMDRFSIWAPINWPQPAISLILLSYTFSSNITEFPLAPWNLLPVPDPGSFIQDLPLWDILPPLHLLSLTLAIQVTLVLQNPVPILTWPLWLLPTLYYHPLWVIPPLAGLLNTRVHFYILLGRYTQVTFHPRVTTRDPVHLYMPLSVNVELLFTIISQCWAVSGRESIQ